jgi:hypothetical protein
MTRSTRRCEDCGANIADNTPDYFRRCRTCYAEHKKAEQAHEAEELSRLRYLADNHCQKLTILQSQRDEARELYLALRAEISSDGRVMKLIRLCHPDKHGNSQESNDTTKWLLSLRTKLKG